MLLRYALTATAVLSATAMVAGVPVRAFGDEQAAADHFKRMSSDRPALRLFLGRMPKGGDLHNHLDGAIYAETYLQWAAEDGKCVDLNNLRLALPPCTVKSGTTGLTAVLQSDYERNRLIDAFSTRNINGSNLAAHDHYFATFGRFFAATIGREADMIADVRRRAALEEVSYLELMQVFGMADAIAIGARHPKWRDLQFVDEMAADQSLDALVAKVIAQTDSVETIARQRLNCGASPQNPGCGVTVRYLSTVLRGYDKPQVAAQALLAAKLVAKDPRYVGLNFAMPEDAPIVLSSYEWQMALVRQLAQTLPLIRSGISLHAGELALGLVPPDDLANHIKLAVDIAGARRIGHGVDIAHETNAGTTLATMAQRRILVEINLTSNNIILGVAGREHPFELYRQHGVPMSLATDNTGVNRTDMTQEYVIAAESFSLSYLELKQLARNSLEYSFLDGDSLFEDFVSGSIVEICPAASSGDSTPEACQAFLTRNPKALLQMDLERQFSKFEARYAQP